MGSHQLKLNEFKKLYAELTKRMPEWFSFLVLGFLVWVEERFINQRIKTEVDSAIKEYMKEEEIVNPSMPDPLYSETGDDFFDEIRLSSSWIKPNDN